MNKPMLLPESSLDALLARARAQRPDTSRVEYAFETRLLARLRESRLVHGALASVSWRMIPFFGIFVLILVLWQAQAVAASRDAEQSNYMENPEAVDMWNSFN
jgi:hypothetical protein